MTAEGSSSLATTASNTASSTESVSSLVSSSSTPSSTPSSTSSVPAAALPCFAMLNNTVLSEDWGACGPVNATNPNVPCCANGDYCMTGGLCHYTHSEDGGSSYYAAGCTDTTYADTNACPRLCDDRDRKDVVWNTTMNLWYCCGEDPVSGVADCQNPTDESFQAPPALFLQSYWLVSTAHSISTTSSTPTVSSTAMPISSSATVTAPPTAYTTTQAASHHGLSAGAAAGIGVVCGIVAVALVGGAAWLFLRRRRQAANGPYKLNTPEMATDANAWPQPPADEASVLVPPRVSPKHDDLDELEEDDYHHRQHRRSIGPLPPKIRPPTQAHPASQTSPTAFAHPSVPIRHIAHVPRSYVHAMELPAEPIMHEPDMPPRADGRTTMPPG